MPSKNKFYTTTPVAPAKKLALRPLVQNAALSTSTTSKVVPGKGMMAGGKAHGFGHSAGLRKGHLRHSGVSGAHRVGAPKAAKVP